MNQTATRPIAVTDNDFTEQVLRAEQPVLVDFWAEWCGPCRALGPIVESLAEDFEGRVKIAKLDVDANQQVAMKYGIRSIPTVMLFNNGDIVESFVGVRPKSDYEQGLQQLL